MEPSNGWSGWRPSDPKYMDSKRAEALARRGTFTSNKDKELAMTTSNGSPGRKPSEKKELGSGSVTVRVNTTPRYMDSKKAEALARRGAPTRDMGKDASKESSKVAQEIKRPTTGRDMGKNASKNSSEVSSFVAAEDKAAEEILAAEKVRATKKAAAEAKKMKSEIKLTDPAKNTLAPGADLGDKIAFYQSQGMSRADAVAKAREIKMAKGGCVTRKK